MNKIKIFGLILLCLVLLPALVFFVWQNPDVRDFFSKKNNTEVEINSEKVTPISTVNTDAIATTSTSIFSTPTIEQKVTPKKIEVGKSISVPTSDENGSVKIVPKTTDPQVLNENPVVVEPITKEFTLDEIYKEWSPYVVRIYCDVLDSQGIKKSYSDGSGFLTKNSTTGRYFFLTTSHVFTPNDIKADYCDITFPENGEIYHVKKENMTYSKNYPNYKGAIYLENPSAYVKNLYAKLGNGNGEKDCVTVDSGEQIMVLGYPMGSNKAKVSYSTGEILKYNQPFYISTAKIISGYSGGIAVSLKNNCLIGIPVYALKENLDHSMIFDIYKY